MRSLALWLLVVAVGPALAGPTVRGTPKGAPPAGAATVEPGAPVLSVARLEVGAVAAALGKRTPALRACYRQLLAARPGVDVDATVRFVIDGRGRVRGGALAASDAHTGAVGWPAFEACAARAIAPTRFARPTGGHAVAVRYPLRMRASPPPAK